MSTIVQYVPSNRSYKNANGDFLNKYEYGTYFLFLIFNLAFNSNRNDYILHMYL